MYQFGPFILVKTVVKMEVMVMIWYDTVLNIYQNRALTSQQKISLIYRTEPVTDNNN